MWDGLLETDNEPIEMALDDDAIIAALETAVQTLKARSVGGPYSLVCSLPLWTKIQTSTQCYPLKKRIESLTGGKIVLSPQYDISMLVSSRGGDSELVIGQDFSVGYQSHTSTEVNFYITESFTFRVLTPEAIVPLKLI